MGLRVGRSGMRLIPKNINEDGRRRSIYEGAVLHDERDTRDMFSLLDNRRELAVSCGECDVFTSERRLLNFRRNKRKVTRNYFARKEDDGWKAYG